MKRGSQGAVMPRKATAAELRWFIDGEPGLSSATVWSVMTGESIPQRWRPGNTPRDPDDLRRCVLLLDRFPRWRKRLAEVAETYPEWTELVAAWPELEALLRAEMAAGAVAKRTYSRIQEILAERCLCGRYRMDDKRRHRARLVHGADGCGFERAVRGRACA